MTILEALNNFLGVAYSAGHAVEAVVFKQMPAEIGDKDEAFVLLKNGSSVVGIFRHYEPAHVALAIGGGYAPPAARRLEAAHAILSAGDDAEVTAEVLKSEDTPPADN